MSEPIPSNLYSEDSGEAHAQCKICQKTFGDHEVYGVQKVYKNYPDQEPQVLFDFALCQECMEEARAELSKESRQRVDQFMLSKLHEMEEKGIDASQSFKEQRCTLSQKPLQDTNEYQVVAVCRGKYLWESPMVLSDDILDQIQDLLSPESRNELNRFSEENFGWPPELKKIWQDGDFVLL